MVDYVSEMTAKKSCWCGECGSLEHLLFLFVGEVVNLFCVFLSFSLSLCLLSLFEVLFLSFFFCLSVSASISSLPPPPPPLSLSLSLSLSIYLSICILIMALCPPLPRSLSLEQEETIATFGVGYADGYNRLLSGKGVLKTLNGKIMIV